VAERHGAIEIEGRRFAWRMVGRGATLLLVNGYAATSEDWDPSFLMSLARHFEVICPDNRGVGGSELGDGELCIDAMAAELEALLDALDVERACVVGWSMGGYQAQRLAELAPERVSALALIGTHAGGEGSVVGDREVWERLTDHSSPPREQASRLISVLFPPAHAAEVDRQFGDTVAAARAGLAVPSLLAQEAAMVAWRKRQRPQLATELPPTAVIHGALDVVIPAVNAPQLGERWRTERIEVLDGCGHAVMAQEPARVADIIAALAGSA
jgi:pimeloyl-ACP methyl ester carboxylesterase